MTTVTAFTRPSLKKEWRWLVFGWVISSAASKLSLSRGGEQKVNDESIRDTLIDLANYAIMTVVEMEVADDAE